jgi:hypothetical protein
VRVVFIIGVPAAILAVIGALCMRNDKMPTKEEEAERMQKRLAAEEAAAAAARGEKKEKGENEAEAVEKRDPEA